MNAIVVLLQSPEVFNVQANLPISERKMRNSFFCFIDPQVQISVDAFNEFGTPADIDFF
jgi:hypothetical protein